MPENKKVLIVGGVAGGASCAARLRRLDENAEIILFDRGPHVSFANCGLPYYVGNVIKKDQDLLVTSVSQFRERFRIDIRTENEVTAIDRQKQEIEVRDLATGRIYRERYDALVLSPGASPVRPPLPGLDLPGIFTLRTVEDGIAIREWIEKKHPWQAVVVGGGYIGLEMAEALAANGMYVDIVEMLPQVLPNMDADMAALVELG